jgi:hypothetical protein
MYVPARINEGECPVYLYKNVVYRKSWELMCLIRAQNRNHGVGSDYALLHQAREEYRLAHGPWSSDHTSQTGIRITRPKQQDIPVPRDAAAREQEEIQVRPISTRRPVRPISIMKPNKPIITVKPIVKLNEDI